MALTPHTEPAVPAGVRRIVRAGRPDLTAERPGMHAAAVLACLMADAEPAPAFGRGAEDYDGPRSGPFLS